MWSFTFTSTRSQLFHEEHRLGFHAEPPGAPGGFSSEGTMREVLRGAILPQALPGATVGAAATGCRLLLCDRDAEFVTKEVMAEMLQQVDRSRCGARDGAMTRRADRSRRAKRRALGGALRAGVCGSRVFRRSPLAPHRSQPHAAPVGPAPRADDDRSPDRLHSFRVIGRLTPDCHRSAEAAKGQCTQMLRELFASGSLLGEHE